MTPALAQSIADGVVLWSLVVCLGGLLLCWAVWDVWVLAVLRIPRATVSARILEWVSKLPPGRAMVYGFLFGAPWFFLLGHLVWPQVRG